MDYTDLHGLFSRNSDITPFAAGELICVHLCNLSKGLLRSGKKSREGIEAPGFGLMRFPVQPQLPERQASQHDQNGCWEKSMIKEWHKVRV